MNSVSVPSAVQDLSCGESLSPSNLFISWKAPPDCDASEVLGYRVSVRRLKHKHGTRQVIEFDITNFNLPMDSLEAFISEGLGRHIHQFSHNYYVHVPNRIDLLQLVLLLAAAEVPYVVSVKALSLAGCGDKEQVYCFTREGGMYEKHSG